MMGVIPLYRYVTRETVNNLATEKIQMADKILQSIREEVIATDYKAFPKAAFLVKNDYTGEFSMAPDLFFPAAQADVVEAQRRFKDYVVEAKYWFPNLPDTKSVQVELVVTWSVEMAKRDR